MSAAIATWLLTDHVCRNCFGRVMKRSRMIRGVSTFRCSNCGAQADGADETAICCCGLTLQGKKDMGVRCQVNTARSLESKSEIVARVKATGA